MARETNSLQHDQATQLPSNNSVICLPAQAPNLQVQLPSSPNCFSEILCTFHVSLSFVALDFSQSHTNPLGNPPETELVQFVYKCDKQTRSFPPYLFRHFKQTKLDRERKKERERRRGKERINRLLVARWTFCKCLRFRVRSA